MRAITSLPLILLLIAVPNAWSAPATRSLQRADWESLTGQALHDAETEALGSRSDVGWEALTGPSVHELHWDPITGRSLLNADDLDCSNICRTGCEPIGSPLCTNPFINKTLPGYFGFLQPFFRFNPDLNTTDAESNLYLPVALDWLERFSSRYTFGDVSSIMYLRTVRQIAVWDAQAPFLPKAVGIYTRMPRQAPPAAADVRRVANTAHVYASFRVLMYLGPENEATWRDWMVRIGLDPDDNSTCSHEDSVCSPVATGNTAGFGVIEKRIKTDGFNWDGTIGRPFHPKPLSDYTGYVPANTAYELLDSGRWQPEVTETSLGVFKAQQFVTPQWALTETFAPDNSKGIQFEVPEASDPRYAELYKIQAQTVLTASAELTPEKKLLAEYYDNKGLLFGNPIQALFRGAPELDPFERQHAYLVETISVFDSAAIVWGAKRRFDAVRPFSAIRSLFANKNVTAYGGPGIDTVDNLPGDLWQSYMPTADHPEFPSATACFCSAVAETWRKFFGTDEFENNITIPYPPGVSWREPGITPSSFLAIQMPTLTAWADACAESRVDGGTHFPFAVEQSMEKCHVVGSNVYAWYKRLLDGTEPPRPPARPLPISSLPEAIGPYASRRSPKRGEPSECGDNGGYGDD